MEWTPLVASAVLAMTVAVAATFVRAPDPFQAIDVLRRAGVFLALGTAFFMDDPAAVTVASMPATLLARRSLRLAIGLSVVVSVWAAVVGYVAVRMNGGGLPVGALTLETGAALMVGFAVAAVAISNGYAGGPSGAVSLFLLSWLMPLIPARWSLVAGAPGDADWSAAHLRWGVVLVVATATTLALSLDPARRRIFRQLRRV